MNTAIMLPTENDPAVESTSIGKPVIDITPTAGGSGESSLTTLVKEVLDFCFYGDDEADSYPVGYESATLFLCHKQDE